MACPGVPPCVPTTLHLESVSGTAVPFFASQMFASCIWLLEFCHCTENVIEYTPALANVTREPETIDTPDESGSVLFKVIAYPVLIAPAVWSAVLQKLPQ